MIFDCFTYFNEYDLLDVRINTLAPYVDAFVLCEANRTFQGAVKPWEFSSRFPLFDKAQPHHGVIPVIHGNTSKTVYIVRADLSYLDRDKIAFSDLPDYPVDLEMGLPWMREYHQRKALKFAHKQIGFLPEDRIILSDVDEIPRPVPSHWWPDPVVAWSQGLYYYFVNLRCWKWTGPVSCTWQVLNDQFHCDFQALRDYRHCAPVIDGGWHFSFLGGPSAIKKKIEAFSHTEYKHFADLDHIEHALTEDWKHNRDLFGRDNLGMQFELMPDDSHLPPYLVANKERFKHWWYTNGAETE